MERPVSDLPARIRARIESDGPITFRDWMDLCLYDPDGGYYMAPGRKTGPADDADFATSPTLHPFMGEAVAKEAVDVWERLESPDVLRVAEFGGGEGDLARTALDWLAANKPELTLEWTHVEISPTHRAAQADARIQHAESAPKGVHLVVAHEFVDALPFHILEWRKGNWAEVRVANTDDGFAELLTIPTRSAIEAAPKRQLEDGQRVVAMADAQVWLDDLAGTMGKGRVLVVDYGDTGARLWTTDRPDATVRGFRDQAIVEPLDESPGSCDITASVDFTQLEQWAVFEGFRGRLESQESFLVNHGVLEALATAPRDTLEDASAYLRLKQLMLPQGLGQAFKVLRLDRGLGASNGEG